MKMNKKIKYVLIGICCPLIWMIATVIGAEMYGDIVAVLSIIIGFSMLFGLIIAGIER